MKTDKVEVIVPIIAIMCALMLAGLVTNIWPLVFAPIPIMAMALIFLGSLNSEGEWGPTLPVLSVYGVILVAIFAWIGISMESTALFGGMQMAMGVIYYVLWPFITVTAGLLYAWVYSRWLSQDVALETGSPAQGQA